jgi:hypothetical protein
MDKRKVLSIEGRVKGIRQIESGKKKADLCWKFGFVNSMIQTICKKRTKFLVRLNRTDREYSEFESLYEVASEWRCLNALSEREVTMYQ